MNRDMHTYFKFFLITLFSVCWGLLLTRIKNYTSPEIIKTAIIGVLSIFITMFCIGVLLIICGIKLENATHTFLSCALLFVIISFIVIILMKKYNTFHKSIAVVIITIMSLYIIYDTHDILHRHYKGDFITASIDYYLDILNIFVGLINFQI